MMKYLPLLSLLMFLSLPVAAQQGNPAAPDLPDPLKRLIVEGAQVRYLGQINGLDGWVTIRQGQEQYFYVTPDLKNFVMGLLFDDTGRMLTIDQVQSLRKNEGEVLDLLAEGQLEDRPRLNELAGDSTDSKFQLQSPSEQLYSDMEQSNWVPLGNPNAPVIYTIVDPQCPHCHQFLTDLKDQYIKSGKLQVRLIPIGLREETKAQAAFLLAAPNPEELWFKHLAGDQNALPAKAHINKQGVQHNLSIIENWRLDSTPFTVYKAKDGSIKIIRGRADNPESILKDLVG